MRSFIGNVFTLSVCTISWKALLQAIVILSTIKAEYIILIEAVNEAIWFRGLLGELNLKQDVTIVRRDSYNALYLTKNHIHLEITKWINNKYHLIHEIIS